MTAVVSVEQLETPVTVVDLDRLERNVERMASLAREKGVKLRPMIKTHKSPFIASLQMKAGGIGVLVASIDEAEVMAAASIRDITIAYPFIDPAQLERIVRLAETSTTQLTLSADSTVAVERIATTAAKGGQTFPVLILIDSGGRRLGVQPEDALPIAQAIQAAPNLRLAGVATHAGHAYGATSDEQLQAAALSEAGAVVKAAETLRAAGMTVPTVAVGSTPTASRVASVRGITEMRPGNYVFYDAMQVALGVATEEDCALTIIGTVLSRPTPQTAVVDVGSKMLSSDRGAHGLDQMRGYGIVVGEPELVIERISEELSVVTLPENHPLTVGQRLQIIPNHACVAANLVDTLIGVRQGRVERTIPVQARRRNER